MTYVCWEFEGFDNLGIMKVTSIFIGVCEILEFFKIWKFLDFGEFRGFGVL